MSSAKAGNDSNQIWGRVVFVSAIVLTTVLVFMGVTGVHWPKWLLALATVL